jgi:hypothetical protein
VCLVALLCVARGTIAAATRLKAQGEQAQEASARARTAQSAKSATVADASRSQQKPKRALLIHVPGPDGLPMAGVEVHRSIWTKKPFEDANRRTRSDDKGQVRFELPEGITIFRLWARANGHVPLFAHWEEEDKPETSLPAEFTFRLERGTVIGGVVRDSDGGPIKNVAVEVSLERGGRSVGRTGPNGWLALDSGDAVDGTAPKTDEQGRWVLDNVPPGDDLEIRLKLNHPDYISDAKWGLRRSSRALT